MQLANAISAHKIPLTVVLLCALVSIAAFAWLGRKPITTAGVFVVSQKGRQFSTSELNLSKGDIVRIINDDGNLRHHAYVSSPNFKFDSGDQEPGSKTDIVFPAEGTFDVLCAIHPKMKLVINVK
jgi:plastocyanin